MKHSIETGFSFGVTSGIITTLGLIVGLHAGTGSRLAVLGGIVTIAVADAFSDALGIHVSEESEGKHSQKEIWESTISTFISKFVIASVFLIPMLLLDMQLAIQVSVGLGVLMLAALSYRIGKKGHSPWTVVAEHVAIALVVVIAAHYIGEWVSLAFG